MVFIPIKCRVVLFCPSGVYIFLPLFIWFIVPFFRGCTGFFYMLVFFPGVALAWRFNKTCIYHFSFIGKNTGGIKRFVERGEQAHDYIFFYQFFPKMPKCFAVRNFIALF